MEDGGRGRPSYVDAGCFELVVGGRVGLAAVECGVENDLGVYAPAVGVDERAERGGIGQLIHRHAQGSARLADDPEDGRVACFGLLDQTVDAVGSVQRRRRWVAGAPSR